MTAGNSQFAQDGNSAVRLHVLGLERCIHLRNVLGYLSILCAVDLCFLFVFLIPDNSADLVVVPSGSFRTLRTPSH